MKAVQKNITVRNRSTKLGHSPLRRIKGYLKLGSTSKHQAGSLAPSLAWYSQAKDSEALKIELEIRRNQAIAYASFAPPK